MRAAGVAIPSAGSSRSPPLHTLRTIISVVHAIFNTTFSGFPLSGPCINQVPIESLVPADI